MCLDNVRQNIGLPPSSEGLVQFYQGDVFVGDGIAQFDLGIEITALCIQHIDVVDDTLDVLGSGEGHIFA